MFTNSKISISQIIGENSELANDLEIVRDFSFSYVGKLPINLPDRLVSVSNASHLRELMEVSGVAGVLTTPEMIKEIPDDFGVAICSSPYIRAMEIHEALIEIPNLQWCDFETEIDPTAEIHASAVVARKNVKIGPGCKIGPNSTICERVIMGKGCTIGPGSVIGCEAYDMKAGSSPQRLLKQSGGVQLGENVIILSCTTVVRATFGGFTIIEDEASVDNLVHIAHDCHIGKRAKIVACSEVSGRVQVGEDSYIGPNVTVSNGLKIGQKSTVTLGSVVVRDVEENDRVTGNFALPHSKWISFIKSIR